MSTSVQRSTSKSGRQSVFFRDLASPVSSHRGKFSTPGQAAAVSALWRENFGGTDLPPPPNFTLEDRADFSPEPGIGDYPASPDMKSPRQDSISPVKSKGEASTSHASIGANQMQRSPASSNWWSPTKSNVESDERGKGSPVDGVVQSGALITLPPPREVARPELQHTSNMRAADLEEEEWITVYGFSPGDTNMVLREFENCGPILKHVPGPKNANWIHILYQNRFDSQKALGKNGTQINGVLIIGVKPIDPAQRYVLNEQINNRGFMIQPLPATVTTRHSTSSQFISSPRPHHGTGAIAAPAKSVISKITDLMFGV